MNANQLMLHNAVTNRVMDLYINTDLNAWEISQQLQEEINDSIEMNEKIKVKSEENILSILNKVITNIKANGNDEEWAKVCIATIEYVKTQVTYIEGECADGN